ncbi:DUF6520 family protein [Zhouia sp. PK063]|uniref:DUF6520 family protein n=1 Tax=Zhouia sp. PK063 TaxID=3373602 RepID=UPI00379FE326
MKKFKFLMPVMAFAMAIGLAFATNAKKATGLWVDRGGSAYELQTDPCSSTETTQCKVIFADDPNAVEHPVFTDQSLQTPKEGGTGTAYVIEE